MTKFSRRTFLAAGGSLALASACGPASGPASLGGSTPSPSGPAASAERTLRPRQSIVIGFFGGAQEPVFREFIQKPLEVEQNAEVLYVSGSAGGRRTKVIAEKGAPSFDVVGLALADVHEFVEDGIVMPSNPNVPHFDDVEPWATERGYVVGAFGVGLRYNPNKIDKPTSFDDLWNPKYKGHVAIPNLAANAVGPVFFYWISKMLGGSVDDTEAAWKRFAELKPNLAMQYASTPDVNVQWKAQDIWIATDTTHAFLQLQESLPANERAEQASAVPKEGMPLMGNSVAITVGTKVQELAESAVGYFLSEPFQKAYAEATFFAPTRKNITLSAELEAVLPKKSDLSAIPSLEVGKKVSEWADRWNREMIG